VIRDDSSYSRSVPLGTTDKLAAATADLSPFAPIVIVRLRNMTAIDATALHALEELCRRLHRSGA
jgi:SulP family sulfate permease